MTLPCFEKSCSAFGAARVFLSWSKLDPGESPINAPHAVHRDQVWSRLLCVVGCVLGTGTSAVQRKTSRSNGLSLTHQAVRTLLPSGASIERKYIRC